MNKMVNADLSVATNVSLWGKGYVDNRRSCACVGAGDEGEISVTSS